MFDSKMGTRMLRRSSRARRLIRVGASCIDLFVLVCRPRPRVCSGVEGLVGGEQRELSEGVDCVLRERKTFRHGHLIFACPWLFAW